MAVESTKETQRVMHEMTSAVLDVRPMLRGSEKAVVESAQTPVEQLRRAVEECGYHRRGQSAHG